MSDSHLLSRSVSVMPDISEEEENANYTMAETFTSKKWFTRDSMPFPEICEATENFKNISDDFRKHLFNKYTGFIYSYDSKGSYGEIPAPKELESSLLVFIAKYTSIYYIMLGPSEKDPSKKVYRMWSGPSMLLDLEEAMKEVQQAFINNFAEWLIANKNKKELTFDQSKKDEPLRRTMSFKHGVTDENIESWYEPTAAEIETEKKRLERQKIWDESLKKPSTHNENRTDGYYNA